MRGADAPVGVAAVAPVLAARLAGHALASATGEAGQAVARASLQVAESPVQTGAGLPGPWTATWTTLTERQTCQGLVSTDGEERGLGILIRC